MFVKKQLDLPHNIFLELSKSAKFEDIIDGRQGTVLVLPSEKSIPIVRTTTKYDVPAQQFQSIHFEIIEQIKFKFKELENINFNNALIELYDPKYKKMGYHSDQALDLADKSYICLFSCYENYENYANDIRKLVIKNKKTNNEFEILLENNSVVLFSTDINKEYLHKIILNNNTLSTNKWLGLTLRLSKTYINFENELPILNHNGKQLRLVDNENEKKEFYIMRSKENQFTYFNYPELDYTISPSDLMNIYTMGLV